MWDVTPCRVGEWASDTVGLASSGPLHSYYFFRRIRRLALVCVCVYVCGRLVGGKHTFSEVTGVTLRRLSQRLEKRCCERKLRVGLSGGR